MSGSGISWGGPYASLHLAPDRLPHQHPTTLFLQAEVVVTFFNHNFVDCKAHVSKIQIGFTFLVPAHLGRMPFLPPNQQRQSTEDTKTENFV